jgi:hypothetical protein
LTSRPGRYWKITEKTISFGPRGKAGHARGELDHFRLLNLEWRSGLCPKCRIPWEECAFCQREVPRSRMKAWYGLPSSCINLWPCFLRHLGLLRLYRCVPVARLYNAVMTSSTHGVIKTHAVIIFPLYNALCRGVHWFSMSWTFTLIPGQANRSRTYSGADASQDEHAKCRTVLPNQSRAFTSKS